MAAEATELRRRVFEKIDGMEEELIKIALDLSNIDASPDGKGKPTAVGDVKNHEKRASDYVHNWLSSNGFHSVQQGLPERPNVLSVYRGEGGGRSLLFNSHLDVSYRDLLHWRDINPDAPYRVSAWRDGDGLVGQGICNCKGPMACWLISTKAIRDLGIILKGDVVMSAVVGETGGAPIDEYPSPKWDSHELGARYAASHGAIADYALIAEATAFRVVPAMTGFAYFKVTIFAGPAAYTPFLKRPEASPETSVSAIVRMARFIKLFEQYANNYSAENTQDIDGSTMVPNATIGGIRAGMPFQPTTTPEVCSIYCDFRIAPGMNPLDIQRDLEKMLGEMKTEGKVEMYKYLPGYKGKDNPGFSTFNQAVIDAHSCLFPDPPEAASRQFVSMWRDINPYNELGIPAISYGFPTGYTQPGAAFSARSISSATVKIADMITAAKVYAAMTLDLCNRSVDDPL